MVVAVIVIVVVVVIVIMVVIVAVVMMMTEQLRRDEIHDEPEDRDRKRVVVIGRMMVEQLLATLVRHVKRDEREQYAARVARQRVDLAGAEAERIVTRACSRIPVRSEREPERADVRAHVPAVGLERDRVGVRAPDQLADHHHRRDEHHPARPALPALVVLLLRLVMSVSR